MVIIINLWLNAIKNIIIIEVVKYSICTEEHNIIVLN